MDTQEQQPPTVESAPYVDLSKRDREGPYFSASDIAGLVGVTPSAVRQKIKRLKLTGELVAQVRGGQVVKCLPASLVEEHFGARMEAAASLPVEADDHQALASVSTSTPVALELARALERKADDLAVAERRLAQLEAQAPTQRWGRYAIVATVGIMVVGALAVRGCSEARALKDSQPALQGLAEGAQALAGSTAAELREAREAEAQAREALASTKAQLDAMEANAKRLGREAAQEAAERERLEKQLADRQEAARLAGEVAARLMGAKD